MAKRKVIRLGYLKRTAMGNKAFLKEVMGIFVVQVLEEFSIMEKALSEKNWSTLADYAHKMRLSINIMGMKESEELLLEIENEIHKNDSLDESIIATKMNFYKLNCETAVQEVKEVMRKWGLCTVETN